MTIHYSSSFLKEAEIILRTGSPTSQSLREPQHTVRSTTSCTSSWLSAIAEYNPMLQRAVVDAGPQTWHWVTQQRDSLLCLLCVCSLFRDGQFFLFFFRAFKLWKAGIRRAARRKVLPRNSLHRPILPPPPTPPHALRQLRNLNPHLNLIRCLHACVCACVYSVLSTCVSVSRVVHRSACRRVFSRPR